MKNLLAAVTAIVALGAVTIVASDGSGAVGELIPDSVRGVVDDARTELAQVVNEPPSLSELPSGLFGSGGTDAGAAGSLTPSSGQADPDRGVEHAAAQVLVIGGTSGLGISIRSDCAEDARTGAAIPDDAPITLLEHGEGPCAGWLWVTSKYGDSWVRESFVFSAPPNGFGVAAPPPPPTSTPAATTTPLPPPASTPAPAPSGPEQVAVWFGDIPGSPGDSVSARIGATDCESSEVLGSTLATRYFISISSHGPCQPTAGVAVSFLLNGTPLSPAGTWQPDGSTELNLQ